MKPHFCMCIK